MNRADLYYLPAELDYRRELASRRPRNDTRWPRSGSPRRRRSRY